MAHEPIRYFGAGIVNGPDCQPMDRDARVRVWRHDHADRAVETTVGQMVNTLSTVSHVSYSPSERGIAEISI